MVFGPGMTVLYKETSPVHARVERQLSGWTYVHP